jgi:hypothetical protein
MTHCTGGGVGVVVYCYLEEYKMIQTHEISIKMHTLFDLGFSISRNLSYQ